MTTFYNFWTGYVGFAKIILVDVPYNKQALVFGRCLIVPVKLALYIELGISFPASA